MKQISFLPMPLFALRGHRQRHAQWHKAPPCASERSSDSFPSARRLDVLRPGFPTHSTTRPPWHDLSASALSHPPASADKSSGSPVPRRCEVGRHVAGETCGRCTTLHARLLRGRHLVDPHCSRWCVVQPLRPELGPNGGPYVAHRLP